MGRHSAPETSHRRRSSGAGRAALVAVAAIAAGVLFGAVLAQGPTASGEFTGSQAGEQESHGAAPSAITGEPSTATTEPPVEADGAAPDPSDPMDAPENLGIDEDSPTLAPDSSDQVNAPENRGRDESAAPMSPESAGASADTSAPPSPADDPDTPTVRFVNCAQAKAAGVSMIPHADPRYSPELDHDGDGTACDRRGDPPTRFNPPPTTPCEPAG